MKKLIVHLESELTDELYQEMKDSRVTLEEIAEGILNALVAKDDSGKLTLTIGDETVTVEREITE